MSIDLTNGPVTKKMMLFSLPLIAGNLLQQTYNIADTVIVGRFLGADALAAVGSSYALMTFLTSILLGLCMGSRSEERRVGKECLRLCRSRWSPYH